jgi:hypothetical protein
VFKEEGGECLKRKKRVFEGKRKRVEKKGKKRVFEEKEEEGERGEKVGGCLEG